MATIIRRYRPCYIDHNQSETYRHIETRVMSDGQILSVFADGAIAPSGYNSEAEMLDDSRVCWFERVREAQP